MIPSEAFAKITCRLVAGQDLDRVRDALEAHLEARRPAGVSLEIGTEKEGTKAYGMPNDHPVLDAAAGVLEALFGRPPVRVGMGGSVPICTTFREVVNEETLFFSFSVGDEDIHAPNEFYRRERFRSGLQAWARLWRAYAARAGGN